MGPRDGGHGVIAKQVAKRLRYVGEIAILLNGSCPGSAMKLEHICQGRRVASLPFKVLIISTPLIAHEPIHVDVVVEHR